VWGRREGGLKGEGGRGRREEERRAVVGRQRGCGEVMVRGGREGVINSSVWERSDRCRKEKNDREGNDHC